MRDAGDNLIATVAEGNDACLFQHASETLRLLGAVVDALADKRSLRHEITEHVGLVGGLK